MVNLVLLNEGDSRIGRKIHQWFKGLTIICTNSMVLRLDKIKFDEQLNCNDVIIASLSVTLSNIPSIVAVAQTSPQNQTMQPMPTIKSTRTIAIGNNKI